MLTYRIFANTVKSSITTGRNSDDFPYTDRQIIRRGISIRTQVMMENMELIGNYREHDKHTICVELVPSDSTHCDCDVPDGDYILRSRCPVPRFIKLTSVDSENSLYGFEVIKANQLKTLVKSIRRDKNKEKIYFKTINGDFHAFVYNDRLIERLTMEIVPEDPLDAIMYRCCSDEVVCDPLEMTFPLDKELEDIVINRTVQTLANGISQDDRSGDDEFKMQ